MNDITTINPASFLEQSTARFFQLVMATEDSIWIWCGYWVNAEKTGQFGNLILFAREQLTDGYHAAARFAKSDFGTERQGGPKVRGDLRIVEMPAFGE
jgi:hypothetical protein